MKNTTFTLDGRALLIPYQESVPGRPSMKALLDKLFRAFPEQDAAGAYPNGGRIVFSTGKVPDMEQIGRVIADSVENLTHATCEN